MRPAIQWAGVPTIRQVTPDIAAELRRCRRYEHRLSVLALGLEPESIRRALAELGGLTEDQDPALLKRFECTAVLILGALLQDTTRESDTVAYAVEDDLFVLFLPETDAAAANRAAARLSATFESRSSIRLRIGLAEFPRDGYAIEDLLEVARNGWLERAQVREPHEVPHG